MDLGDTCIPTDDRLLKLGGIDYIGNSCLDSVIKLAMTTGYSDLSFSYRSI